MRCKVWVDDFNGKPEERIIDDKQLAEILINLSGGGWSTSQTIKAWEWHKKVMDNKKITINYKNTKINIMRI